MNNPTCQQCGTPLKLIPAGISKTTGRPYNAFQACPNKCPKTPNPVYLPNTGQPAPNYAPRANFKPPMATPKTDWEAISWGKCKHAYLVEAYKDFIQKPEADMDIRRIEKLAEMWADMSMRKLPKAPEMPKEVIDYANQASIPTDDVQIPSYPF